MIKAFALSVLTFSVAALAADTGDTSIRPIEQPRAIRAMKQAACSQTFAVPTVSGNPVVFWRKCGEFDAYMNIDGKLVRLEYVDAGEYPRDRRLPYRDTWVGHGLVVTVNITREEFCAEDDATCEGVRHEAQLTVEGARKPASIQVAGYSGY